MRILVYAMGVLLVGGVIALGIAVAYRIKHHTPAVPAAARAVIPPDGLPRSLRLPEGATILGAQSDGDRVMVRIGLAGGGQQLILLDWKTGAKLSTIELK